MNILHMSDLHLGRRFYNLSFLPIQQALLQEVLQIIDDQQVTVLLLCGDIYDNPVPPADAVQLLDWFLTQLAARSVHVCMISGNHDSPERLDFGSGIFEQKGVYLVGQFNGLPKKVTLGQPGDRYFEEAGIHHGGQGRRDHAHGQGPRARAVYL